MEPGSSILLSLLILIVLVLVNAFFAMSEIAIISINANKMKKKAEEGDKKAATLVKITESSSSFLATIQVGVTLSGLLASAVAAERFASMLVEALAFLPIDKNILSGVSLIVITLILSYFTLIFGELVPKRLALRDPEKIAMFVCGIVWKFYRISKPFVKLLAASTNGILRLFGIRSEDDEQDVTEEDILLMVDQGEETGILQENETDMIRNIFEFDDKEVSDVMTHRTSITAADTTASIPEVLTLAQEEGFSRIPIYKDKLDNIIGVVYIKDLIPLLQNKSESDAQLSDYMRTPIYIPEGKKCSALLKEFQETKVHIAIVIDEHGGTAGLVTMEDLLEAIVGDIEDEYDNESEEIQKVSDDCYLLDGGVYLDDIEDELHIDLFDNTECDTIGGFVLDELGRFPAPGEQVTVPAGGGWMVTVLEMDERRVTRVRLAKINAEETL